MQVSGQTPQAAGQSALDVEPRQEQPYQPAPADGERRLSTIPASSFQAAALGAISVAEAGQQRATQAAEPPDARAHPVQAWAAACRILDETLRLRTPEAGRPTAEAMRVLLATPGPASGHVDQVLTGFLKASIEAYRPDLIDAFVDTICGATGSLIAADRQSRLLLGLCTPAEPRQWAQLANRPLTKQQGTLLPVPQRYAGPPLLGRLCRGNRDPGAHVSLPESRRYAGIHHFLIAVLRSDRIGPELKIELVLSEFLSAARRAGDVTHNGWERKRTQTAVQVAVAHGELGAACAVLHALSEWKDPAGLQFETFRALDIDVSALFLAIDAVLRSSPPDPWFVARGETWATSIAALVAGARV